MPSFADFQETIIETAGRECGPIGWIVLCIVACIRMFQYGWITAFTPPPDRKWNLDRLISSIVEELRCRDY